MRVLLMPHSYYPTVGGTERVVRDLALGLKERGHTVAIVAGYNVDPTLPARGIVDGIPVRRFHYPHPALPWRHPENLLPFARWGLADLLGLDRLSRRWRPDVVHLHSLGNHMFHVSLWQRWHRFPFLVTTHGIDLTDGALSSNTMALGTRRVLRQCDFFTSVWESLVPLASEIWPPVREKTRVIRNGLPLDHYGPDRKNPTPIPPQPAPLLFAVGRLDPIKGFDVLLRAMPAVIRAEPRVRLVLAGVGPQEAELRELVHTLQLGENVVLWGLASPGEVASFLAAATLFVLPSRYDEASMTFYEAMASGSPILATCSDEMLGQVGEDAQAVQVPPDNPEALAQGIIEFLGQPERRAAMAQKNLAIMRRSYSLERVVSSYESLYLQAIAAHAARGARR